VKKQFLSFAGKRRNWSVPYILFLGFFVVIPLILIVYYAFTNDSGAFTLDNFSKFRQQPEAMHTFLFSVGVAMITTFICLLLGYPAAYILSRMEMKQARNLW
jgi:spermidine/putrescine transport system permease protein